MKEDLGKTKQKMVNSSSHQTHQTNSWSQNQITDYSHHSANNEFKYTTDPNVQKSSSELSTFEYFLHFLIYFGQLCKGTYGIILFLIDQVTLT